MRRSNVGSLRRALPGAIALLVLLSASPSGAAPVVEAFDRTDNDYLFTYQGDGDIPTAVSSARTGRRDKVSFFAYVRGRPGAPEGRELAGILELTLATRREVRYAGRFALIVRTLDGTKVVRRTKERSFTLRSSPGDRRRTIRFRFDLEPGRYWAFARFKAPEA